MAKKGGAGIAAKPPASSLTRVSPGVYRDAKGNLTNSGGGSGSKQKQGGNKKNKKEKAPPVQSLPGLTPGQNTLMNQTQENDIGLGQTATGLMPQIEDAYAQPFDYSQLPQTPWSQGQNLEQMNQEYYDKAVANYDRSMQSQFQQEDEAFRQRMYNEGVPEGSEKYNKLFAEQQKSRAAAKQNAMDSAYFNAGQNATTWNNLGTQNFQNAYGFAQDKRNQSLSDYTRLMAAQSGMNMQNLGYTQALGLQNDDQAFQKYMMKNTPRGGGGGGGGGSQPLWQQYGFKSPMEFDAYQTDKGRQNKMWEWQNNPQYQQGGGDSGPSYWAQLGGSILGSAVGGWSQGGFKPFW